MKMRTSVITVLAALAASQAFADTTATSTTSATAVAPSTLKDVLSIRNDSVIYGPQINRPDLTQPDGSGLLIENSLKGIAKLGGDVSAGLAINAIASPVGDGVLQKKPDATLVDPYLFVKKGKLINVGVLNVAADLRGYVPLTTAGSNKRWSMGGLRFNQNTTISAGALTAGVYTFERINFYGGDNAVNAAKDDYFLYAAPNASYSLSDSTQATLWMDIVQYHKARKATEWVNDPMQVQPGVNFDISKAVSFNPYINIMLEKPTLASSSINAALGIQLF